MFIRFFIENKLVTLSLFFGLIVWGVVHSPFDWNTGFLPKDPIPVDAIPDYGENQQIVATEWMGKSPKDIEDQISYPLTSALLGISGVKTIRSTSMFGMSFIYIIFDDEVEFYWSRSRILEKLNSLPPGTLPKGVQPSLGPDATALGQIYWYTLEGRDPKTGKPTGGWDPHELRTIQDFYVKYSLAAAEGVSEVASVGGYIKEYQVDVKPEALKAYNVTVMDVMNAVRNSNLDIGAETIELNKVEYLIRGLGYIKNLDDLRQAVVTVRNNVPVRIADVANVSFGPGTRRGGLDKAGAEAAGGVVVARYGSNPRQVIDNVKAKITELAPGLPSKELPDGTISKVTIVPFYDRSGLISETIGTLEESLSEEILITIIVIIVAIFNLRASFLISSMLPVAVLMTFIAMKLFGVDANIVALSGIAIAIGVMVDVGVVFVENIIRHKEMPENRNATGKELKELIIRATNEIAPAVTTALLTTVVSFFPVFVMEAAEGKLFRPLAFTKSFAILATFFLGMVVLPLLAYFVFNFKIEKKKIKLIANWILIIGGVILLLIFKNILAVALVLSGLNNLITKRILGEESKFIEIINVSIALFTAVYLLTINWLPLGAQTSDFVNLLFVGGVIGIILLFIMTMIRFYEPVLRWGLRNKALFLSIPAFFMLFGMLSWLGFNAIFGFTAYPFEKLGWKIRETTAWQNASQVFPGIGNEFMPALDEGSFLLMPTGMPHTGIEQNLEYVKMLDMRMTYIPEVDVAVGKWGRVNSALDPAPTQMFENTINYKSEYILDKSGHRIRFKVNKNNEYILSDGSVYNPDSTGFSNEKIKLLVEDNNGNYFRQWRKHIKTPDDIWNEIVKATEIPGLTAAPKLQPIQTRLVMLSTGLRAPMGLKVFGPTLDAIENAGLQFEKYIKEAPEVVQASVFYDRSVAAPYIEIKLKRENIARYGMSVSDVQEVLEAAVGGMTLGTTVEGRERFPIRLRYPRELRNTPEELQRILVPSMSGVQVPLGELAEIAYTKGPQMIRSENSFLVGYVIFDKLANVAEVDAVKSTEKYLRDKIASGEIVLPEGVSFAFAGNYEQQVRAEKRLSIIIPLVLLTVFLILYFQFRTVIASLIHFSGVFVAFAGGFMMLWLYAQPWFMNFEIADMSMRELFQIHTINLSVAVWVGFIALFGIATDDGVLTGTYIHQTFEHMNPKTVAEVREAVVAAVAKRIRPALMTTAATLISLLPVLTSTGKGADIMVPMAIPAFGGMLIQTITIFVVPIFQAIWRENEIRKLKN